MCQTCESFSLSGSPLQLPSPSQLPSRRRCQPPSAPPQGCPVMPHCTALVGLTWLFFLFMISQDLVVFLSCTKHPETPHLAGMCTHNHWDMMLFPRCVPPSGLSHCPVRHLTTDSLLQHPSSSWLPPLLCPKGVWGGWWVSPEGSCSLGTAGSWGVSVGPGCDLVTGGTTQVFPVRCAPRHLPVIK